MLIMQLMLETRQLWGNNGKDETIATFLSIKELFQILTFRRMSNFRTRFEQFLTPRTSVRCISPKKNRYFIKMQFLYFPRSKKIASTDFPISDKSFSANFFQGPVFLSGELLGNLNNWFQFPESFSTSAQEVE